jgi:hypothetical protein
MEQAMAFSAASRHDVTFLAGARALLRLTWDMAVIRLGQASR